MATTAAPPRRRETLESAVIRFAGDSGDGMQITGSQFTNTAALFGNDLATFPDYPAEIRAPAGTLPGVSGFQVHFGASDVYTPGDAVDALVAMNPAALKVNLSDLKKGGILIVNADDFKETDLRKAGVADEPARGPLARGLPRLRGRAHASSPAPRCGRPGSTPRAWTGARTSSRSACATGSTTGRWSPPTGGSTTSSRPSRSSPRRTSSP